MKRWILALLLVFSAAQLPAATPFPEAVSTSTTTLTLQPTVGVYTFTGSSPATWTLPAVSGNKDRQIIIKNRGSATITVQRAGSDQLYTTSAVTSTTVTAGGWAKLVNDGVYWAVLTAGSGGLASTDIDTSAELAGILTDETGSGAAVFGTSPTFAGGTVSSSTPIITGTQTWNNAGVTFTGLELNVTDSNSASGSLLVDFQVGGSSKFSVRKDGVLTTGKVAASGSYVYGAPQFYSSTYGTNVGMQIKANNEIAFYCSGTAVASVNYDSGITLGSTNSIGWVNGHAIANPPDLFLYRDAANTLALRNGVNAQAFNIYNTWGNSGTDYERLNISYSGNIAYIQTENGGTGSARHLAIGPKTVATLFFCTNNIQRWSVIGSGHLTAVTDNAYDIGASGANRPRSIYVGTNVETPAMSGTNTKTLTETTDTAFVNVTCATDTVVGGIIEYTIQADDTSAFQVRSGSIPFSLYKAGGGAVAGGFGTAADVVNVSSGTLTATWAMSGSGSTATLKCNATSSLTQTTLVLHYRVIINGPAVTVTPQ